MNQIDNIMELYEEAAAAMCNVVKNPGDKYWIDKHQWHYDKLRAAIEQLHAENEKLRRSTKELATTVKELCAVFNIPLPEATLARAGEKA